MVFTIYSLVVLKFTLFTVSKDKWHTKENTGKSMKNALYILYMWYTKGTPWAKAMKI